jgi:diadenosine tetraphosphatase ApaH/serine/threonine PP2A family protein phosphatase
MPEVTRIAVLSDVHSNLEALEAVLAEAPSLQADRYYLCGDLVGYGADPEEVLGRLLELPLLGMVAGNHDLAAVDRFPLGWFNPVAEAALRWTASQLTPAHLETLRALEPLERTRDALLVHGSVVSPADEYLLPNDVPAAGRSFERDRFRVGFFGHTHVPTVFETEDDGRVAGRWVEGEPRLELGPNRRYLLNPGSVGQPRDGDPRASFLVYDTDACSVEWHRVGYDVAAAQRKILDAGLPSMLAERLSEGR